MVNDESRVAELLPEPSDGAVLAVDHGDGDWKVIWRDDAEAGRWDGPHDSGRWFDDNNSDPMGLYQHVKYARAVYRLDTPVAVFR
jgi:hypothetical protein